MLELPEEIGAGLLVMQEELLDLGRVIDLSEADSRLLASRMSPDRRRLVEPAQGEPRLVALHLGVARRLAIDEGDLEAELCVKQSQAVLMSATNSLRLDGALSLASGVGNGLGHGLHS